MTLGVLLIRISSNLEYILNSKESTEATAKLHFNNGVIVVHHSKEAKI